MTLTPCLDCGTLSPRSRCETHRSTNGSWSPNRNHATHKRFARAVKQRDNHRCVNCGATQDLRACHRIPKAKGGPDHPDNGLTLCKNCDRASDSHAR